MDDAQDAIITAGRLGNVKQVAPRALAPRHSSTREFVAVLLLTGFIAALGLNLDFSSHFAAFVQTAAGFNRWADLGPAVLFLCVGLAALTARMWMDAERAIGELRSSENARSAVESRYESIVETSPDPVVLIVDGAIAYANAAAAGLFRSPDTSGLLGLPIVERLPEDMREEVLAGIREVLQGKDPVPPTRHPFVRLDGSTTEVETAIAPTEYMGRPAIQAVVRDMTARRQTDEALARYQVLSENSQDLMLFLRPDGEIVDCNRAALLAYGYPRDELLGINIADLSADGAPSSMAATPSDLAGAGRLRTAHRRQDGSRMDMSVTYQSTSIDGDPMLVAICRDVTEQQRIERDLVASEQRYRHLNELSPVPMVVYDLSAHLVFANPTAVSFFRARDLAHLLQCRVSDLIHPDSRELVAKRMSVLAASDDASVPLAEEHLLRLDGTSMHAEVIASRCVFDGRPAVQVVLQDVSQIREIAETLKETTEDVIEAMALIVEQRDPYTSGHQARVSSIGDAIAADMGLPESTREAIRLAGLVHDVGKINVPSQILGKPGSLTNIEFELVKTHVEQGYEVLRAINFPWPIADVVRQHHERLDGSGYPHGLRGDDIRLEARILAVADVLEAVSSHRPYRPALGTNAAIRILLDGSGTLFDQDVVESCVRLIESRALPASAAGCPAPELVG